MKRVLLILLISCTGILYGQKYTYTNAQLMQPDGTVVESWLAASYIHFNYDLMTISSTDPKVLQTISPVSLFDQSTFRNFVKQGNVDTTLSADSVQQYIYITRYMSMIYYNKISVMSTDERDFIVIVPNNNLAIVLYNKILVKHNERNRN